MNRKLSLALATAASLIALPAFAGDAHDTISARIAGAAPSASATTEVVPAEYIDAHLRAQQLLRAGFGFAPQAAPAGMDSLPAVGPHELARRLILNLPG